MSLVGALAAVALVASACGSTTPDQIANDIDQAAQEAGSAVAQAGQDAGSGGGSGGGDTSGGGGDSGSGGGGGDSSGGGGDSGSGGGGGDTSGGGGDSGSGGGGGDTSGGGGGGNTSGIPATDPNTGANNNDTPWWLLAIMLGLVGLLIGFILRGNRQGRTPARQEVAPVGPPSGESTSDALSTAQWMVDDLAIDITNPQSSDPQGRMSSASPRLDDAHIAFINHYNETGNEVWNELSRELSATRSGLEQYAQVVSQPGYDRNTAQQASQVVNEHRNKLNSLIQQGWDALRAKR